MSDVYANGMEVSAKKDDNKSTAAMPDVCLSPPTPPAGPIPIPYPNTAMASDTSDGSKTVQIGGDEVGLKNKSTYKKSSGDEAATKSQGMGVISHNIQGAMQHAAWSMDVKLEGENAIRHMDLTTHNHGSPPQNPGLNQGKQQVPINRELTCEELENANEKSRSKDMRPSAENRAFTSTTASFTPPPGGGSSVFMKAMTPGDLIKSGSRSGYANARPPGQKMACTDEQWGAGGSNNHTEPKLIEQLFPTPGAGTLKMSIFHKMANNENDALPCPRCEKGICKAKKCGMKIILCQPDEKEPVCDKNDRFIIS